jgi:hypothetical protein
MGNDRRVRHLVVDERVWGWTVRQRVKPNYADCRLTLSLFPEVRAHGVGRRLDLVFAPSPDRIVSNSYFEAGTVVRLPDDAWLNLYEPGTVRRLLDAAAPALDTRPSVQNLEVDGWPYFAEVVDQRRTQSSDRPCPQGSWDRLGPHGVRAAERSLSARTPHRASHGN